jgi:hypothetical protein
MPDDAVHAGAGGPTFELPTLTPVPGNLRLHRPEYLKPLIASFVPEAMLDVIVQEVLGKSLAAIAPNEVAAGYDAILTRVIAAVAADNKIENLLAALRRAGPREPRFHLALSGLIDLDDPNRDLQAIMGNVAEPFLAAAALKERFPAAIDQICAIWIDGQVKGTGFLIGPDLVLTCQHVIEALANAPKAYDELGKPRLVCLFDYLSSAEIGNLQQLPSFITQALPVQNGDWLVDTSEPHPDDGKVVKHATPDPTGYLDFAVIRLAEPIGMSSVGAGGGPVRGWIELPKQNPDLHQGGRLFVVQHPAAEQLQFDLGVYMASFAADTRILYGANAVNGSSGAPCFDSQIKVVGLHTGAANVSGDPARAVKANHGIRLDRITRQQKVADALATIKPWNAATEAPIWSLSTDPKAPWPVVGRQRCFDSLAVLLDPASTKRALVVAEPEALQDAGGHGKTFTIHILRAVLRDKGHIMIPFGLAAEPEDPPDALWKQPKKQGIPKDPAEWLTAIGRGLGWSGVDFADMEERPTGRRQSARWISTKLPTWFATKLEDKARAAGLVTKSPEGSDVLTRLTWIVIDDVHRPKLDDEIGDLIAGLLGLGFDRKSVPAGLRSLRFVIIGHVPDALRDASQLIEREDLNANQLTLDELATCVKRAYQARAALRQYVPAAAQPFLVSTLQVGQNNYRNRPKDFMRFIGEFMSSVVQNVMK